MWNPQSSLIKGYTRPRKRQVDLGCEPSLVSSHYDEIRATVVAIPPCYRSTEESLSHFSWPVLLRKTCPQVLVKENPILNGLTIFLAPTVIRTTWETVLPPASLSTNHQALLRLQVKTSRFNSALSPETWPLKLPLQYHTQFLVQTNRQFWTLTHTPATEPGSLIIN